MVAHYLRIETKGSNDKIILTHIEWDGNFDEFFKNLGFTETPPLNLLCKIVRPYMVNKNPYYTEVTYEVDFAKDGGAPKLGLMRQIISGPGSATIVRVKQNGIIKYAFLTQERFLLGTPPEIVRGWDKAKKELEEELGITGSEPKLIGHIRPNTGLSRTSIPNGATPIYLVDMEGEINVGKGEKTEKLHKVLLLSLPEVKAVLIDGSLTDPWFAQGLLLLWAQGELMLADSSTSVTIEP